MLTMSARLWAVVWAACWAWRSRAPLACQMANQPTINKGTTTKALPPQSNFLPKLILAKKLTPF
jgi:hypothetical protein